VLKAKYYPQCDFLNAPLGHGSSLSWRSIWSAQLIGQKHQFGVFLKTIYQNGAVLKLFIGGSVFICIVPKAGAQLNRGLTCGMNLLCQKLCAMSCYKCSGATTFRHV